MLPYPGPCPNNRALALWPAAGPIAQQIHLLGSPGLLMAARLQATLGAKGQAEHTGCCCGALPPLMQHAGVLRRSLEEQLAQKPEVMRQHHERPDQSTPVGSDPASLGV